MKDLIFVSAHAGTTEDGRKYAFITLSNGIRAFNVDNTKGRVDVSGLKEGDRVKAEFDFDVNYKNNLQATVISLVKLK